MKSKSVTNVSMDSTIDLVRSLVLTVPALSTGRSVIPHLNTRFESFSTAIGRSKETGIFTGITTSFYIVSVAKAPMSLQALLNFGDKS